MELTSNEGKEVSELLQNRIKKSYIKIKSLILEIKFITSVFIFSTLVEREVGSLEEFSKFILIINKDAPITIKILSILILLSWAFIGCIPNALINMAITNALISIKNLFHGEAVAKKFDHQIHPVIHTGGDDVTGAIAIGLEFLKCVPMAVKREVYFT